MSFFIGLILGVIFGVILGLALYHFRGWILAKLHINFPMPPPPA